MKKLISVALLIAMMCSMFTFTASAATETSDIALNLSFEDIETNQVSIPGLTISGGKANVAVIGTSDKALYLKKGNGQTSVIGEGMKTAGQSVIFSFSVKGEDKPVNLTFGTASTPTATASADVKFVRIENNIVLTHDGKRLGSVSKNNFTTLTVIAKKGKVSDYYINGRKVLSNWTNEKTTLGSYVAIRQPKENSCYIDNLRIYKGNKIRTFKDAAFTNKRVDVIGQSDFTGDVTFFDNRYCYTSGAPRYLRTTIDPKSNEIVAHRLLNYQSPDREDYIYMRRKKNVDNCYIGVDLTINGVTHPGDFKHRYLKVEGDFKSDKLQQVQFVVIDHKSTASHLTALFNILDTGAIEAGGKTTPTSIKKGEWFHLLWALNLDTKKFDIYINDEKVVSDIDINKDFEQFNIFRIFLSQVPKTGDLYIDNFDVTGLIKPIVDGVETKTTVLPDTESVEEFLADKIGMHAYGNIIHKDGVKSELATKGIFDYRTQEYYAPYDTLNKAFDLNLSDNGGEITGEISVKKDGTVTLSDGMQFKLDVAPKVENGKLYVPIKQFATDAVGKFVWSFQTGIILFSDYELNIDTKDWIWFNMRDTSSASGCMRWNDIDHLNGYLQYVRPSTERLKEDFIKTTGDNTFSSHPRLYYTADEFKKHREVYQSGKDPVFNKMVDTVIKTADDLIRTNMAYYTDWSDLMRHGALNGKIPAKLHKWCYAYQITGDQKYVDAAAKQFEIVSTFPDFNTAHVIDSGAAASGLAVGYDWFYNAFTPEQRKVALETTQRCLNEVGSGLYGRITSASNGATEWRSFRLMSNYNTIVNSGIIMAAIATLESDTENVLRYIKDSTRSIEYTCQMLPPGGAWTEGPAYLSYALRFFLPAMINMEKNFGSFYNITEGQGMEAMLDFFVANSGPGGMNNQGDADHSFRRSYDPYFYLARRYNKPYGSYIRYNDIKSGNVEGDIYDLRCYDFDAANMTEESLKEVEKSQIISGNELYAIRDTYDMANSEFYFAAHFGTTTGYHQQFDCSTFVLDIDGTRWAHDLGTEAYTLQNELGYHTHEIFRKRAEAHNMLVLNPRKFNSSGEVSIGNAEFAPIIDAASNEYGGYVYADMSEVYPDAVSATTGYYIADNMTSVTVRNEFELEEAGDGVWGLITSGTISIDGDTAVVTQNLGSLRLQFITDCPNAKWVDNGSPKPFPETVPADKFAKQKQNQEYRQLKLLFDTKAGKNKVIIKISPEGRVSKPIEDKTFSEWKLPEKIDVPEGLNNKFKILYKGKEVVTALPVYDDKMPELQIIPEDPNAIVEVEYAKNVDDATRIKVWDSKKLSYRIGTVRYYKASGVTMGEYSTLPIYGIEVSSQPERENIKENMLDDDLTTRWTAMGIGEYAIFDLESVQTVDGIAACFFKGDQRRYMFNVFVSEDGKKWTKVYKDGSSSGKTLELEAFAFDKPAKARYIKLEGQGNTGNPPSNVNINVVEFRALSKKF